MKTLYSQIDAVYLSMGKALLPQLLIIHFQHFPFPIVPIKKDEKREIGNNYARRSSEGTRGGAEKGINKSVSETKENSNLLT